MTLTILGVLILSLSNLRYSSKEIDSDVFLSSYSIHTPTFACAGIHSRQRITVTAGYSPPSSVLHASVYTLVHVKVHIYSYTDCREFNSVTYVLPSFIPSGLDIDWFYCNALLVNQDKKKECLSGCITMTCSRSENHGN